MQPEARPPAGLFVFAKPRARFCATSPASEVEAQANQTATATGDIAAHIDAIRARTGQAFRAIEGIVATIGEFGELSHPLSGAIPDAIPDAVPDAIPDAIPDVIPDAIPDTINEQATARREP